LIFTQNQACDRRCFAVTFGESLLGEARKPRDKEGAEDPTHNLLPIEIIAGPALQIDIRVQFTQLDDWQQHIEAVCKAIRHIVTRPLSRDSQDDGTRHVLTTHQQASVSLSQAWGEAGLAAIGRLDPSSPNSVELPFPSKEQAEGIIVAHLDDFRINEKEKGSIKPFTKDGIDALLAGQTVHPRATLSNAAKIVRYAADKKHPVIDAECAKAAGELKTQTATPDFTEGIEGAV
jgi:hypothetical protein